MKIGVGDIVRSNGKQLLVVHNPSNAHPYILINLDNFEVDSIWPTLDWMENSIQIDSVLYSYGIRLVK